jgi:hypothetical protein
MWCAATIYVFVILARWLTVDPQIMVNATTAALVGSTALLLMPGSTALVAIYSSVYSTRRNLMLGCAACVVAACFYDFLWFGMASAWCVVAAGLALRTVSRAADRRAAAAPAIAAITAVVLPIVALTSWYVFADAIPTFLGMLLDAGGRTYGVAMESVLDVKDRMRAMMSLGEPLAFTVVGIIWNAGALILVSFHGRFAGSRA